MEANSEAPPRGRGFWPTLGLVALVALVLRLLLRAEYLATNPLATYPIVDSLTYWRWAGRIAAGQFADGQPFFSAPLYPYLLGMLRAIGGGLGAVYTLQILLDLTTAGLLARIGRDRFGTPVGLLAAALFLLLLEPASFSLRVLTPSLQLTLVCLTWLAMLAVQRAPSTGRSLLAGAAIGLLTLSYPPAMLCLPLFGVWSWWLERRSRAGVRNAILGLVAGLVVLSPATLHNYRATGEWYLVQAVSGLTLRQGNGPGASGTITVVPGTSVDREELFRSARREAEATIGRDASWGEIDRHYRNEVLSYWVEDPLRAARLFTRKAYWFLTGRNHGDIYLPTVERSEGIPWRLHLMPLHTAWLIPPALLAIVVWARRPGTYLPELMLFAVPLAVVLLFRYSPRYRLPAIPVIVLGCAWALYQVVLARGQWRWPIAFGVLALSGIGLGVVNRAAGFDALDPLRPQFHHTLADACSNSDRPERALVHYREALELKPDFVQARANLGNLLVRLGQPEAAVEHLREAVRAAPDHAIYHDQLGRALLALDRSEEALGSFRTAVRLQPDHPGMRNNLANTLRGMGRDEEAFVQYRAALQADPTHVEAHFNLAGLLQARGDIDGARQHYSEALRLQPSLAIARQRLQLLEAQQGP